MGSSELDELCDFLTPETRLDIKSVALHHVLSLTGTAEGRQELATCEKAINSIIKLAFSDKEQKSIIKDAFFTLINITSNEVTSLQLLHKNKTLIAQLGEYVLISESRFADIACGVLSNISRGKTPSELIYDTLESNPNLSLDKFIQVFCLENFNKHNNLDYLSPFICNLTQTERARKKILEETLLFKRLLPYTTYVRTAVRRGGIIGAIKNCCFNYDTHDFLIKSDIDLLSRLLLPLAGPEELDDDDMERLPEDLQFLSPDKQRESDPDIRIMLLETLILICSKKDCRLYVKEKNAYVIIRELYKWETEELVKETCEKLVNILISDEPESGHENLHEVVIPESLSQKFSQYDQQDLNKAFEENNNN